MQAKQDVELTFAVASADMVSAALKGRKPREGRTLNGLEHLGLGIGCTVVVRSGGQVHFGYGDRRRPLRAWRVTKYDPADRDERGHYIGSEDTDSDRGPVESAYLAVVAAFARESGVEAVEVREPSVPFGTGVRLEVERFAELAGLFGEDLRGYHDGAVVSMDCAVELVRLMLRGDGVWCRLESGDDFLVHVGWDQYVYVGSRSDCSVAVAFASERGLFADEVPVSPYTFELLDDDAVSARPADALFWTEVAELVVRSGTALLEEFHVHNDSRWHRLTPGGVERVREGLAPRACLLVWPDLTGDVDAVLDSLSGEHLVEIVWEDDAGRLTSCLVEGEDPAVRRSLANARGAMTMSPLADEREPLLAGVLPDSDGVLRARWSPG